MRAHIPTQTPEQLIRDTFNEIIEGRITDALDIQNALINACTAGLTARAEPGKWCVDQLLLLARGRLTRDFKLNPAGFETETSQKRCKFLLQLLDGATMNTLKRPNSPLELKIIAPKKRPTSYGDTIHAVDRAIKAARALKTAEAQRSAPTPFQGRRARPSVLLPTAPRPAGAPTFVSTAAGAESPDVIASAQTLEFTSTGVGPSGRTSERPEQALVHLAAGLAAAGVGAKHGNTAGAESATAAGAGASGAGVSTHTDAEATSTKDAYILTDAQSSPPVERPSRAPHRPRVASAAVVPAPAERAPQVRSRAVSVMQGDSTASRRNASVHAIPDAATAGTATTATDPSRPFMPSLALGSVRPTVGPATVESARRGATDTDSDSTVSSLTSSSDDDELQTHRHQPAPGAEVENKSAADTSTSIPRLDLSQLEADQVPPSIRRFRRNSLPAVPSPPPAGLTARVNEHRAADAAKVDSGEQPASSVAAAVRDSSTPGARRPHTTSSTLASTAATGVRGRARPTPPVARELLFSPDSVASPSDYTGARTAASTQRTSADAATQTYADESHHTGSGSSQSADYPTPPAHHTAAAGRGRSGAAQDSPITPDFEATSPGRRRTMSANVTLARAAQHNEQGLNKAWIDALKSGISVLKAQNKIGVQDIEKLTARGRADQAEIERLGLELREARAAARDAGVDVPASRQATITSSEEASGTEAGTSSSTLSQPHQQAIARAAASAEAAQKSAETARSSAAAAQKSAEAAQIIAEATSNNVLAPIDTDGINVHSAMSSDAADAVSDAVADAESATRHAKIAMQNAEAAAQEAEKAMEYATSAHEATSFQDAAHFATMAEACAESASGAAASASEAASSAAEHARSAELKAEDAKRYAKQDIARAARSSIAGTPAQAEGVSAGAGAAAAATEESSRTPARHTHRAQAADPLHSPRSGITDVSVSPLSTTSPGLGTPTPVRRIRARSIDDAAARAASQHRINEALVPTLRSRLSVLEKEKAMADHKVAQLEAELQSQEAQTEALAQTTLEAQTAARDAQAALSAREAEITAAHQGSARASAAIEGVRRNIAETGSHIVNTLNARAAEFGNIAAQPDFATLHANLQSQADTARTNTIAAEAEARSGLVQGLAQAIQTNATADRKEAATAREAAEQAARTVREQEANAAIALRAAEAAATSAGARAGAAEARMAQHASRALRAELRSRAARRGQNQALAEARSARAEAQRAQASESRAAGHATAERTRAEQLERRSKEIATYAAAQQARAEQLEKRRNEIATYAAAQQARAEEAHAGLRYALEELESRPTAELQIQAIINDTAAAVRARLAASRGNDPTLASDIADITMRFTRGTEAGPDGTGAMPAQIPGAIPVDQEHPRRKPPLRSERIGQMFVPSSESHETSASSAALASISPEQRKTLAIIGTFQGIREHETAKPLSLSAEFKPKLIIEMTKRFVGETADPTLLNKVMSGTSWSHKFTASGATLIFGAIATMFAEQQGAALIPAAIVGASTSLLTVGLFAYGAIATAKGLWKLYKSTTSQRVKDEIPTLITNVMANVSPLAQSVRNTDAITDIAHTFATVAQQEVPNHAPRIHKLLNETVATLALSKSMRQPQTAQAPMTAGSERTARFLRDTFSRNQQTARTR